MAVRTLTARLKLLVASLGLAFIAPVLGADSAEGTVDPAVEAQLRKQLDVPAMGLVVDTIEHSAIEGLYRVQLLDGPAVLATGAGDYFVLGDIYSVGPDGIVNLEEERRAERRRESIAAVEMKDQIIFPAEGETRGYVSVFTDVSCFYCQKLHKEVPELNRRGIEVRYLAYPRQGLGSPGFRQLATAWCSDNRQETLTRLKNREELDEQVCAGNPIAAQFQLGQDVGVRGTPAIVTADGVLIPGYRSADDLIADLGLQ